MTREKARGRKKMYKAIKSVLLAFTILVVSESMVRRFTVCTCVIFMEVADHNGGNQEMVVAAVAERIIYEP